MVTGYGFRGGRGRCYTLWMDFMACAERHRSYGANVCQAEREDYIECLHHTKLAARLDAVKEQKKKLIKEGKWPPK